MVQGTKELLAGIHNMGHPVGGTYIRPHQSRQVTVPINSVEVWWEECWPSLYTKTEETVLVIVTLVGGPLGRVEGPSRRLPLNPSLKLHLVSLCFRAALNPRPWDPGECGNLVSAFRAQHSLHHMCVFPSGPTSTIEWSPLESRRAGCSTLKK